MFEEYLEHWHSIQQTLKPLRLTRWQMAKLLAAQINRDNPVLAKLVVFSLFGLLLYFISSFIAPKRLDKVLGLPVLRGSRNRKDNILSIVKEGKQKYSDAPYIIDAAKSQYVVYPPSAFDEIKRLSEKEASVQDFFSDITRGYFGHETDALYKTIAIDLARSIPLKIPSQQKDARIAFDKYVGYCPEFKSLAAFDTLIKISGSINASSFGGRELGTSEWPKIVQRLLMSVVFTERILDWVPSLLQPIFRPILDLPALRARMNLRRMLTPIIRRDIEEYERAANRKEILKATEDGKLPFTQWLMARYQANQATPSQLTTDLFLVNTESTLKSAIALYGIIVELAKRPQLQDELRREVEEVSMNGQLPSTNLKDLRKMDSVMREASRVNPFSLFTLCRKTRRPVQLSLGPMLPAGAILCVDAHAINQSTTLFPDPENFDSARFLSKRGKPGTEHAFQFVSTGPSDPNFGDGTQACPGRFFANSLLKVCLTHLLMNYDIKLSGSQRQTSMISMPNGILGPNIAAEVSFKSRN